MAQSTPSTDTDKRAASDAGPSREEMRVMGIATLLVLGALILLIVVIRAGVEYLLVPALFVIGHYLGVALHELGHLLAGQVAGFQFVTMEIGPLKIVPTPQGLRPELRRIGSPASIFGGSYLGLPKSPDKLARRVLLMASGGPLASLLTIAAFVVLWQLVPSGPVDLALLLLACWWSLLNITGLIPMTTEAYSTDGQHFLYGILHPADTTRAYALRQLYVLAGWGQRPRDWDIGWIAVAIAPCDNKGHEALANHLAYYWAWDRGNRERADSYLDKAISTSANLSPGLQHSILTEAAFYHAGFNANLQAAHDFLQQAASLVSQEGFDGGVSIGLSPETERLRAEAAILHAEGHLEEAQAKGSEWLALHDVPHIKMRGMRQVEREWIEQALQISSSAPVGGQAPEDDNG